MYAMQGVRMRDVRMRGVRVQGVRVLCRGATAPTRSLTDSVLPVPAGPAGAPPRYMPSAWESVT